MVMATTNVGIGLNVLTEFIIGYMLPGRPLAMMMFKTYGYITMSQALFFLQDLKLGRELPLFPNTPQPVISKSKPPKRLFPRRSLYGGIDG